MPALFFIHLSLLLVARQHTLLKHVKPARTLMLMSINELFSYGQEPPGNVI